MLQKQKKPSTNPAHDYAFLVAVEAIRDSMRLESIEKKEDDTCYCDTLDKIGGICYCCSVDCAESLRF